MAVVRVMALALFPANQAPVVAASVEQVLRIMVSPQERAVRWFRDKVLNWTDYS